MEKAFDTVWHKGLIYKLISHEFPSYLVHLVKNYLSDRSFAVNSHSHTSKIKQISAGVPQGSLIGPFLFNLFINDMPRTPDTALALFADDTAVYTSSWSRQVIVSRLNKHLEEIESYCNSWKLKINYAKTEFVVFSKKRSAQPSTVTIAGNVVRETTAAKYLGVTLDKGLTFRQHITEKKRQGIVALKSLYPLINRKSGLSPENKLAIYKTIVRPMILYAAPVFSNAAKSNLKHLQVTQNAFLRLAYGGNRYTSTAEVHTWAEVEYVKDYISRVADRFFSHQIRSSVLTRNVGAFDEEKAPFRIKHRLIYRMT
jgi:hypothetical protein